MFQTTNQTMSFAMKLMTRASAKPVEMIQCVCVCLSLCMCIWLQNVENQLHIYNTKHKQHQFACNPQEKWWKIHKDPTSPSRFFSSNTARWLKIRDPIAIRLATRNSRSNSSILQPADLHQSAIDISDIIPTCARSGHLVLDHSAAPAAPGSTSKRSERQKVWPPGWFKRYPKSTASVTLQ